MKNNFLSTISNEERKNLYNVLQRFGLVTLFEENIKDSNFSPFGLTFFEPTLNFTVRIEKMNDSVFAGVMLENNYIEGIDEFKEYHHLFNILSQSDDSHLKEDYYLTICDSRNRAFNLLAAFNLSRGHNIHENIKRIVDDSFHLYFSTDGLSTAS